jgi:hypothetical protein
MTPRLALRNFFIAILLLASAVPASATDGKKRAVQKPGTTAVSPPAPPATPPEATLAASVRDAVSDLPVINADVQANYGTVTRFTRTNQNGSFTLDKMPLGVSFNLVISRDGYETFTTSKVLGVATVVDRFQMAPRPTVQIKTASGAVHQVASNTIEFGYIVPFSGFTKDRKPSMCKADGTPFAPDRDEIKRLVGPATLVSNARCCDRGPAMAVTLELRSGETTQAFFTDSCFGYAMLVVGLDQRKGTQVDVKLTDVTEIVFP